MQARLLLIIFLALCLSGCATTQKGHNTQIAQLKSRINYLETELREREDSIYNLENELERIENTNLKSKDSDTVDVSTRQIQIALKNAGFYNGPIDGKIGPKTKESIKVFQRDNSLKPDGVVGKKTWLCLKQYLKR